MCVFFVGGVSAAVGSFQQQIYKWHTIPDSYTSHLCGEQLYQLNFCRTGDLGEYFWWCLNSVNITDINHSPLFTKHITDGCSQLIG